jgi:23S rRNA (cytosine1962-C5)-methyltransferase
VFERHGVDSSRPALEMAEKNAALNGRDWSGSRPTPSTCLREYAAANRRYDTIVLDPPAFAKTKRDLDKALRGYKELNLRAMKMLRPGGILVTCSCSFHVSAAEFLEVVADAARDAHKDLRLWRAGERRRTIQSAECAGNELPAVPDIECK